MKLKEAVDPLLMPSVAILCGGLGTRLRSAVTDRPKALADVAGRPFLAWVLDLLVGGGFRHVVLCTGYMGQQIEAQFGASYQGLQLRYSLEQDLHGTGGALRHALPLLGSENILVMNGDSYCQADLGRFYCDHATSGANASMLLCPMIDTSRYGSVKLTQNGFVDAFHEKNPNAEAGWINAGVYIVRYAMLEAITPGAVCSLEREMFPYWINLGLRGVKSDGPFVDIGTPESYSSADLLFRTLSPSPFAIPVSPIASIEGLI